MEEWIEDITGLAEIASAEPQLAYAASVYGTSKRWNFLARTTPGISSLLYRLEYHIKDVFIPAILGKIHVQDDLRCVFSLPARMGGLGIGIISETADLEYANSTMATQDLVDAIFHQKNVYTEDETRQKTIAGMIRKARQEYYSQYKAELEKKLSPAIRRQLELLSEKGASCWLTSLHSASSADLLELTFWTNLLTRATREAIKSTANLIAVGSIVFFVISALVFCVLSCVTFQWKTWHA